MAKKVVVPEEKKKKKKEKNSGDVEVKKKRSVCCTCCIVALIVTVVLLGAAFGVGWYFGDKYSKQYLGLSLGDTLGVLGDLYWTDDEDVVTNPYNGDDLNGFYGEIKHNILLKEDAQVDFDGALKSALDGYLNKGATATAKYADVVSDGESSEAADDNSIMDIFVNMIAEVFNADNIDKEELKNYSETNDNYIFKLKDKQLAAFVGVILDELLASDGIEMLDSMSDMINFGEVVDLKQICFKVQTVSDEQGNQTGAAVADITVWIGLQKAAGQAIKKMMNDGGFGWAGGIASWLGNVILPENLYATVTVPLEEGAKSQLSLNDMDAAERERAYKLVDGILKSTGGGDASIDSYLNDFTDIIKPYLESAAELMNFDDAAKGTINIDLIGTMANMASEGLSPDDPLTKPDFLYMLQAMLTSSPENRLRQLEPYLYREWYGDPDGVKPSVYKYDDSVDVTGLTHIDYEQEFVKALADAYALEIDTENTRLTDILALLGISLDGESSSMGSDELFDYVSPARLKSALDSPSCKLQVTDRMLASALSGELDSLLTKGGSQFENMSINLDALTFVSHAEHPTHTYARIAVELDIAGMLEEMGGDNIMTQLASKALPSKILMSMDIDITVGIGDADREGATFMLNDYANTERVLNTVKKFVPSFDMSALTGDIQGMLVDMVTQLNDKINMNLVKSDETVTPHTAGILEMPDIFTVINDLVLADSEGVKVFEDPDDLKDVLRSLQDTDDTAKFPENSERAENTDGFISQVISKYYLNPDQTDPEKKIADFDGIAKFLADGEGGFSATKFRVNENSAVYECNEGLAYLAYDNAETATLNPVMTSGELAYLIDAKKGSAEALGKFEIMRVATAENKLIITLAVDVNQLMPDNKVTKLLSLDRIYVIATVDTSAEHVIGDGASVPYAYPVELEINNMREKQTAEDPDGSYENTLKLIRHFAPDFDIDSQVDQVGEVLYNTLKDLNDSLGGDGFIRFKESGLELAGFYEFLARKMELADGTDPETVRAALQGMYLKPASDSGLGSGSIYNYTVSDLMFNAPHADDNAALSELDENTPYRDREFNSFIQKTLTAAGDGGAEGAKVLQTAIFAADDSAGETGASKHIRSWMNDKCRNGETGADLLADGKDYLLFTFALPIGKIDNNKSSSTGFLPDEIHMTVAIEKRATDGKFYAIGYEAESGSYATVFNNMDYKTYKLLLELMGLNPTAESESESSKKINLKTITEDSLKGLNALMYQNVGGVETKIGEMTFKSLNAAKASLDSGTGTATGVGMVTYDSLLTP